MAGTNLSSTSTEQRNRWFALPVALLFALAGAILLWRRGQNEAPVSPVPTVPAPIPITKVPIPDVQVESPQPQSPIRWLLYLGASLFCGGLLVVLQAEAPELSAVIFAMLIFSCVLYAMFRSASQISRFISRVREDTAELIGILRRNTEQLLLFAGGGAVILAVWSAIVFWDSRLRIVLENQGVMLFILSVLVLWLAIALQPVKTPMMTIVLERPLVDPIVRGFLPGLRHFMRRAGTYLALLSAIALMGIFIQINGQFIKSDILVRVSPHIQFALLVAGTGLLTIGLTGVGRASVALPQQSGLERWKPLWPLALITLLALVLRFWHLDTALRVLIDERSFVDGTYSLYGPYFVGLLQPFSGIAAFPYIYPYWQTLTMGLFGAGLLGFRATSAIIGTLTVPALYFLTRTLFDRKTALLAALFLATFPPHLQFSRIGLNNIADPLFGILTLAFLMRGLQSQKRFDFVMAGIMLGFTQYFYEGGRLMFVPLALLTLVGCIIFAKIPDLASDLSPWGGMLLRLRRARSYVLLMLVAFIMIAAPIYLTLIGTNRPILARFVDSGLGLGSEYWQMTLFSPNGVRNHIINHVLPAFVMYFNQIDSTFFYSRTTPLLLTGMLPLVIIGFAFISYHWRKPGSMLLILWVVGVALGNSMMGNSTSSSRFVIVFPALVLLAAVGLRYMVPILVWRSRWQMAVIAGFAFVLAVYQINFYFNLHLPEYNYIVREANPAPDGYDAAWRSLNFPPHTRVHLISDPIYSQIEAQGLILAWRSDMPLDSLLPKQLNPGYLKKIACGVDHAFFVQGKDVKTITMLHRFFKLSPPQFTPFKDIMPSERFVLYYATYNADDGSLFNHYCLNVGK